MTQGLAARPAKRRRDKSGGHDYALSWRWRVVSDGGDSPSSVKRSYPVTAQATHKLQHMAMLTYAFQKASAVAAR
jgi:hypothetical protein